MLKKNNDLKLQNIIKIFKGDGWFYSPRGISFAFGKAVAAAACQLLDIDMIIRAHQVKLLVLISILIIR